jgi:hypothetical protein
LGYRTGKVGSWTDDLEFALGAVNALNTAPPFVNNEFGYDVPNVQPIGRSVTASLRKNW